jgi:hypothetical protein
MAKKIECKQQEGIQWNYHYIQWSEIIEKQNDLLEFLNVQKNK